VDLLARFCLVARTVTQIHHFRKMSAPQQDSTNSKLMTLMVTAFAVVMAKEVTL